MSKPKSAHKNQHTVPRCYLKSWTDPESPPGYEPYLWVLDVKTGEIKSTAPKNVFVENDFYTIREQDGSRDLRLEDGLGGLEHAFDRIRREVIARHKAPTFIARLELAAFVAALKWRTVTVRDHWRSQFGELLEDAEGIEATIQAASKEELDQIAATPRLKSSDKISVSINEVRDLVENTMEYVLPPGLEVWFSGLSQMSMIVLCAEGPRQFITSDNPCVIVDRSVRKKSFYPATIFDHAVQISVAVSPSQALVYSHLAIPFSYTRATPGVVDALNRRTVHRAKELIASRKGIVQEWRDRMMKPGAMKESLKSKYNAKGPKDDPYPKRLRS
jgi:hypothetical protein